MGRFDSEIISLPVSYRGKAEDVLIAIQYGQELGLKPMQSLQGVCVINGKPTVYGDTLLAVCSSAQDFEYCERNWMKLIKWQHVAPKE